MGSGAPTTGASSCCGITGICYPLKITDYATRYLLACEAFSTTQERYAFRVFERAFQEFGLPDALRTDNGVLFASAHALYGLSTLTAWWLRFGIRLERIAPGHPEQNGRHERKMDGVPTGIRTRVSALKGPRPRPLDDGDSSVILTHTTRPRHR